MSRLCRVLGMITIAGLLAQCGSPTEHQEQPVSRTGSPAVTERPALASTSVPTVRRGQILPALPNVTSTLLVNLQAVDPLGEPITLHYQWLLGEETIAGATEAQLPLGDFLRGQSVSVEVTPVADGRTGPVWRAPPVRIGNAPPRVDRLEITPSPATRREVVKAVTEVSDPDGDEVTLSYQWLRNGTPIPGATEATLAPDHFQRGDWLAVQVVASDWQDAATPLRSKQVDVLLAAPKFVSQVTPENFKGGRFRYQAQAVHPDEKPLHFTLSGKAPPGMQIDAETGLVEWEPGPSEKGTFVFQVIVEDPNGAKVAQPITLTIGGQ